jgi:hypothetical protein
MLEVMAPNGRGSRPRTTAEVTRSTSASRLRSNAIWIAVLSALALAIVAAALMVTSSDGLGEAGVLLFPLLIVLIPMCVLIARRPKLQRELRRDELRMPGAATLEADLRAADEERERLGRLVSELGPGPARDVGRDALRAADRAAAARRTLLLRRHELVQLRTVTRANHTRKSVGASIGACDADLHRIDQQLGQLSGSIAALIDRADDAVLRQRLDELTEMTHRATALAAGFEEIEGVDNQPI